MTPDRELEVNNSAHQVNWAPDMLLGLATMPFLVGLGIIHNLLESSIELGQVSEEIFRGDRLPVLNLPEMETTEESSISQ